MIQPALRLDQAPPVSVPFRFFLGAPPFLVLAAALLAWRGPEALAWRLAPAALALTHLFTLGFMSMVMLGALLQLLPVLAGAPLARPRAVATLVHAALVLGTLALAGGFAFGAAPLFKAAAALLATAFAVFLGAAGASLWRSRVRSQTVRALKLALVALAAAAALGVALASRWGWGIALPSAFAGLHPAWALLGWAGLLALGVAYQVVPMFQLTPAYPRALARAGAATVFGLLILWSGASWLGGVQWLADLCALALACAYVAFGAVTIVLQRRRRRRQADVTLACWRLGMASLIAANALWALRIAAPAALPERADVLIGLLALVGFAGSIITGMLYKIAPFLAWFHLQAAGGARAPNTSEILGVAAQRLQFRTHVAALALLVAAWAWPATLVYPAALALAASGVLLEANLLRVLRAFARARGELQAEAARAP
ncbi:MAG: hypothetical protein M0015_17950 [Betaproteobacteria bacterium]|nr:hypothetical protein [Betaproteobacteria bacterium]